MKYRTGHAYELNAPTELSPNYNRVLHRSTEYYPNKMVTDLGTPYYLRHHSYNPQNGDQQQGYGPTYVSMDIRFNKEAYLSNININGKTSVIVSLHIQGQSTPLWEKMYTSVNAVAISGSQIFIDDDGNIVFSYFHNGIPAVARVDGEDGFLLWARTFSFKSLRGIAVCKNRVWMLHTGGGGPHVGNGSAYMVFNLQTGLVEISKWIWAGNPTSLAVNNEQYTNIQSDGEHVWISGHYWFFVSLAGVAQSVNIAKFTSTGTPVLSVTHGINTGFERSVSSNMAINTDLDRVLMTATNNLGGQEIFIFDATTGERYFYTGWTPGGSLVGSSSNVVTAASGESGFLIQTQATDLSPNYSRFWEVDADGEGVRNINIKVTNPSSSISQGLAKTFRKNNGDSFLYLMWNPASPPPQTISRNRGPSSNSYWSAVLPIKRNPDELDDLLFYTDPEDYPIKSGVSVQYSEGTSTFSRSAGQGVRGWDLNQAINGSGIGDSSVNDFGNIVVSNSNRISRDTLSIVTRSTMIV